MRHGYGSVVVLAQATVKIPEGRLVGLVGPDGAGKSTLLGLLAGARRIQAGRVCVLGGDMADPRHRDAVCARIAYMPQGLGRNLYPELSVFENLDFFGRLFGATTAERHARIQTLLTGTGLESFETRPAGKLSGGMQQKLGLCCALIHDPDLLILDEPTTGVDPLSRRQFWDLIAGMRQGSPDMSILVSTAYLDEADRFDWLIAMDSGALLGSGTPAELKRRTATSSLEDTFVRLLPEEKRGRAESFSIPPRIRTDEGPVIVARQLTRRFGSFTAVDRVSFAIERGEIFGFLGSNGCGKTTTMKMLTGLLPASAGDAELFGRPVDAANLGTRRRVGYMSQSFSLYGELTVRQNLELHARLFRLPDERAQPRIAELLAGFGLAEHPDELASRLPLGIRQRLSLAVAIIHEPELLILDEPTSGVDPIARDAFWSLLVDLARNEGVTIFISTHIMSEGSRCDRISLMHAGTVLACDTPAALISEQRASDLEEAFVACIRDSVGGTSEGADAMAALRAEREASRAPGRGRTRAAMSLTRLVAQARRETLELLHDPVRLAFAFAGSVLLMLVFAYGITMDVEDVRYGALDMDQTPESRAYLRSFAGSRYFSEQAPLESPADSERRLQSGDVSLVLEIPPGFGRDLQHGDLPAVSAWIDGAMPSRGETIRGYVTALHAQHLRALTADGSAAISAGHIEIQPRYRYNPSIESIYAIAPGIAPVLLLLIPAILMAVSIAREKELGSITNFYVTPTTRLEFLVGKQLPYAAIGFVNFTALTLMLVFLFQIPIKGSTLALALGALLYAFVTTGIGLLISTFTRTQVAAIFATAILTMMPTMQFSGLLQPVATLEGAARAIGSVWPAAYYTHLSVGAFTKGLGFRDLSMDLVVLGACIPALTTLSVLAFRRQAR